MYICSHVCTYRAGKPTQISGFSKRPLPIVSAGEREREWERERVGERGRERERERGREGERERGRGRKTRAHASFRPHSEKSSLSAFMQ